LKVADKLLPRRQFLVPRDAKTLESNNLPPNNLPRLLEAGKVLPRRKFLPPRSAKMPPFSDLQRGLVPVALAQCF
jgi:hypothetical protein